MSASTKEQIFTFVLDPQVNYLLERVLTSAGYAVTAIHDQNTSDRMLQLTPPGLLILSEKVPDGDGLDLARRYLERYANLPVLFLVTQETTGMLKEALRAGVTDYLCLPLKSEQILQSVNSAMLRAQRRRDWALLEFAPGYRQPAAAGG